MRSFALVSPLRATLAEFIGTFALMFVGGGVIIAGGSLLDVAFAHGLILAVMVSATMHISGGQFNPAVSVSLAVIGKQSWKQAAMFIFAQVEGAIVAAFLLKMLLSSVYTPDQIGNVGATLGSLTTGENPHVFAALGLEVIATFFLMFVIMGTAVDKRGVGKTASVGGFAIGLTVAANILCIGPLTGASMNPARSIGPAVASGAWDHHWVYWVAPLVGALLAAITYHTIFGSAESEKTD